MLDSEEKGSKYQTYIKSHLCYVYLFTFFSYFNYDKTDLFATAPNLSEQKEHQVTYLQLGRNQDDGYVYNHAAVEMHLLGYTAKR